MRKEAKEDSQVLGLNNWKDKLVSCQELRQDVREGHGRGGEESGEGKGQRPLSSWNKGICWTTFAGILQSNKAGNKIRQLLGTDNTVLPLSCQGISFLSGFSLTGQGLLSASPFPPLPVCFLLALIHIYISNYITVLPWGELFTF